MLKVAHLCFLAASLISAQQAVNYASLGGRVTDPSGAVVEGADVNVRQLDTNISVHPEDRARRTISVSVPQSGQLRSVGAASGI